MKNVPTITKNFYTLALVLTPVNWCQSIFLPAAIELKFSVERPMV